MDIRAWELISSFKKKRSRALADKEAIVCYSAFLLAFWMEPGGRDGEDKNVERERYESLSSNSNGVIRTIQRHFNIFLQNSTVCVPTATSNRDRPSSIWSKGHGPKHAGFLGNGPGVGECWRHCFPPRTGKRRLHFSRLLSPMKSGRGQEAIDLIIDIFANPPTNKTRLN